MIKNRFEFEKLSKIVQKNKRGRDYKQILTERL